MTLTEIASRIQAHLNRFENDPTIASKEWTDSKGEVRQLTLFWETRAYRGGSRCVVRYVGYQHASSLTKDEAERYLDWLNAGNVGRHHEALRETGR